MKTRTGPTAEGFYTPPPSNNHYYKSSTTTEPKQRTCQTDNFHIRHKLPTGVSPYVRAKHVQLIDKDPGKAVSLFWAAINSGDRVDSALKDMAVVMKQLDRSDEAIEAIKSFRSLCHPQSQDSLDNVLVELYKRSGRIEEEIEILLCKLKVIEQGASFGGQMFKFSRSHGRRVQVTVEKETARILGNLAWAYLQLGEYEIAEDKYREGLSLDPDKNMQCNLAYCLLQTHRIEEAKSLLEAVKSSSEYMDESYAKSYERAFSKLIELEQEKPQIKGKGSPTATLHNCTHPRNQWNVGRSFQRRIDSGIRKHHDEMAENVHNGFPKLGSHQSVADSSPVILTQPRSPWRLTNPNQRKKLWNGRVVGNSSRKLSFEQPYIDIDQAASGYRILNRIQGNLDGKTGLDWRAKALQALPHSVINRYQALDEDHIGIAVEDGNKSAIDRGNPSLSRQNSIEAQQMSDHAHHPEVDNNRKNSTNCQKPSAESLMLSHLSKKSWADMVEEEELFPGLETLNRENDNPNFQCPDPCKMTQPTKNTTNSSVK